MAHVYILSGNKCCIAYKTTSSINPGLRGEESEEKEFVVPAAREKYYRLFSRAQKEKEKKKNLGALWGGKRFLLRNGRNGYVGFSDNVLNELELRVYTDHILFTFVFQGLYSYMVHVNSNIRWRTFWLSQQYTTDSIAILYHTVLYVSLVQYT